ncbi:enolase C-terminal domain-like protein [Amycolatopsis thermoflava]|uniref:enolase C-terminal domain-like protein n=1 Tax=Amycolatopsis thermoflava TaxID=84480 RepID=UPI003EBAA189
MSRAGTAQVERLDVHAFTVPVDGPDGAEQDGTMTWDATTMVLVRAHGAGQEGLGYTYGDVSVATFVESKLAPLAQGADLLTPAATTHRMMTAIRNAGRPGAGSMAVSAVDIALWDLKAKVLGLPLVALLPVVHDSVPVYGSGGFTNYSHARLAEQVAGWASEGIPRVKIKVSRHPGQDPARLSAVRHAVGETVEVFVDANGALAPKQALEWAARFRDGWDVSWFEEPVSSADLDGMRLVRERGPGGLDIAAGEYAFVPRDFTNLIDAGAVDCLQADVTRCGGVTGVLGVSGLAAGHQIDLSAHCAPAVSAHVFCAVDRLRHLEYFHDHRRVESIVFDGLPGLGGGALRPDRDRPGLGLTVKWPDAEPYRVHGVRR